MKALDSPKKLWKAMTAADRILSGSILAVSLAWGLGARSFEQGAVAENLPTVEVPRAELEAGLGVLTVFAEKTGLVASNGEARRQIKGGGLKVNDAAVADEKMTLSAKDLTAPLFAELTGRSSDA